MALKVLGFEAGKGPAQVEEGAEGKAVVEDDCLGGGPDEVVADDPGACAPGDGPLQGGNEDVLLALGACLVVPHADPGPEAVHESFHLAAADEGQRVAPVKHGAPGLGDHQA